MSLANTKTRLLNAAGELFAAKGFQATTVAEICERARSNIAAVNYHFGDKENLYRETWRKALADDLARHPPDGGVDNSAQPEARLAGRVRALLARMADPECIFFAIVDQEMTQPTHLLAEIIDKEILPLREAMHALLQACLGENASDRAVAFCHASIIGQCLYWLKMHRLTQNGLCPSALPALADAHAFAEHVVRFSLAGVEAVKDFGDGKV
ncbi:MAG: CerR family C-terminal domain-containing protein [Methylococcales bacterium]|nr:CerR family C-terminal domain-containing protein [Methylococcales bacterium]